MHTPVKSKHPLLPLVVALMSAGIVSPLHAQALPSGGVVKSGSASIGQPDPSTLHIRQTTDRAVIEWNSFSVGQGNKVVFAQPSAASVALNRVTGNTASNIQGSISANGKVFLVNPHGIVFSPTSQISTAGLVASTLDISNENFNAKRYVFARVSGAATGVRNQGSIQVADGGSIAMIADGGVANEGLLSAPNGSVALGSGRQVTLDFEGDGLTQLKVDLAANGLIENSGQIVADGGIIALKAEAADVAQLVVKQSGTLRAQRLENRGGVIVLSGGVQGTVEIRGGVDASAVGRDGGSVEVSGYNVGLFGDTRLDARGMVDGGSVNIRASHVAALDKDSHIDVSAGHEGNGGSVVVWGDTTLHAHGGIDARGGSSAGNGGAIETSGGVLDLTGIKVDASSVHGLAGRWTLDPYDIEIEHGVASGSLSSNPFTASAASTIFDGDINTALDGGTSVTLSTGSGGPSWGGSITLHSGVYILRSAGSAPIGFTLNADAAISGDGFTIRSTAGPLNVAMNTNANGLNPDNGGIVLRNATIETHGGAVQLYGQSDSARGYASGIVGIDLQNTLIDTRGSTGAGNILFRGQGQTSSDGTGIGIRLDHATIESGSGNQEWFGYANGAASRGVEIASSDFVAGGAGNDGIGSDVNKSRVASEEGTIYIFGNASSSDSSGTENAAMGVSVREAVVTTASGHIDMRGVGDGPWTSDDGETIMHDGIALSSDARIRVTGSGAGAGSIVLMGRSAGGGAGLRLDNGSRIEGGDGVVQLRARNVSYAADNADAIVVNGDVYSNNLVSLSPGGTSEDGWKVEDYVAEPVSLGGTQGFALSQGDMDHVHAPDIVVGGGDYAGGITVESSITVDANLTLQNQNHLFGEVSAPGTIDINAPLSVGDHTLALLADHRIAQNTSGSITADKLLAMASMGSVALTASTANRVNTFAGRAGEELAFVNAQALTVGSAAADTIAAATTDRGIDRAEMQSNDGASSNGSLFIRTLSGNLTLLDNVDSGTTVDLAAANVLNNAAHATVTAGERWRIWADTWVGETRGGLAGSGELPNIYDCAFTSTCGTTARDGMFGLMAFAATSAPSVPASGDHFIYRDQPVLTVRIANAARATGEPNPTFSASVEGLILGDSPASIVAGPLTTSATLASPAGNYAITGSYASKIGYRVNVLPGVLSVSGSSSVVAASFVTHPTPPAPPNAMADAPETYVYDNSNTRIKPVCYATGPLKVAQKDMEGDKLEREWTRVRSRPNLANCVQDERHNACADF